MKMSRILVAVCACLTAFTSTSPLSATLMGLGNISLFGPETGLMDVSGDGSTVIATNSGGAFYWTVGDGITSLGITQSVVGGVSQDGSVIVGSVGPNGSPLNSAFRWTQGGTQSLRLFNQTTTGNGVSGDGSIMVGRTGSSAYVAPGYFNGTTLDNILGVGLATTISDDGNIIVGSNISTLNAMSWEIVPSGIAGVFTVQETILGSGLARGVSSDGTVIVGEGGTTTTHAFLWSSGGGYSTLDSLIFNTTSAFDVTADGSIVVGWVSNVGTNSTQNRAAIWDSSNGWLDLNTLLPTLGVDLTGWTLQTADAISDDGNIIVGHGIGPSGFTEGWVVNLSATAVPIPAAAWLFGSGLLGLVGMARRKKS